MQNPKWYPKNTPYNVYNHDGFTREKTDHMDENIKQNPIIIF